MNKKLVTIAASMALLALVGSAFAQGGGQRGQRGQGGQGGFGQRGGMQMGMGGNNASFLLRDANVQEDLKLTAEQKTKLEAVQRKVQEEMSAMRQNQVGGDRESMMAAFQKINETAAKETNLILTAEQQKRLKEIGLQVAGNRALMQPDVQKDLGITDEQKAKMQTLQTQQQAAMQSLFEKMRNQELSREEMQAATQKNNDIMNAELAKILTAEQSAKLKEMQGKPFKGLVQQQGGARRGGGGGGN